MDNEKALNGLLAMVEYFRTQRQMKEAIHCLLATLQLKPPPRIEMQSRLQLALLLHHHTTNSNEAINHLEKVMLLGRSSGQVAELHEIRFEAASLLARIYAEQSLYQQSKSILRKVLDSAAHSPYWYLRLIFQLADMNACERDNDAVTITLSKAAEYSQAKGAMYTHLLCLLCQGSHLLTLKNYQEAGRVLNHCHTILDSYTGPQSTILHAFYLVIQVTHLLSASQLKLAKPHLKQLQQKAKILNSDLDLELPSRTTQGELTAEDFEWLSKKHIFVLVYLVSSMHASSCGNVERAILYAEKALQLTSQQQPDDAGVNMQVFNMLKAHVMETMISCKLVEGKYTESLNLLGELMKCCHLDPKLAYSHRSSLHTLIVSSKNASNGLYVLSLGKNLEQAVAQFHSALQHTNSEPLRLFISVNLAIAYIKIGPGKESELSALVSSIQPDQESLSQSLRAAAYYVKGLHSFTILKLHDAKHYLRETLAIANDAELNKLTASALVLLAQIYLALGTRKEAKDMASPALEIARKTNDIGLQMWAALLVKELQQMSGDLSGEAASRSIVESASKQIAKESADTSHHPLNSHLSMWTKGEWPVATLPQSHMQYNGTCHKEDMQEESVSTVTRESTNAVVTDTSLVHDQSSSSYQMNRLPYTNSPYGIQQSSSSVHNATHHMGVYQHPAHQTNPLHHNPMHQLNHLDQVATHHVNPMHHQVNLTHHQVNLAHQVNPAYQVNPAQLTRHLHHYNPTQVNVPTQVNTSYPHASDSLLHHYQPERMHAMHPQQVHYYNNSMYPYRH